MIYLIWKVKNKKVGDLIFCGHLCTKNLAQKRELTSFCCQLVVFWCCWTVFYLGSERIQCPNYLNAINWILLLLLAMDIGTNPLQVHRPECWWCKQVCSIESKIQYFTPIDVGKIKNTMEGIKQDINELKAMKTSNGVRVIH